MKKVLTLLFIVFGLLLAALLTRSGDMVWMALPFLAYLFMGILQSVPAEATHLQATRCVERRWASGGSSIEVSIIIGNQGTEMAHLRFDDPLLPGMKIIEGQLQQSVALQAGEEAVLKYVFECGRGRFAWKTIEANVTDPFGLLESKVKLAANAEAQAPLVVSKLRPFPLRPQHTLHSAGSIPARLGGSGTDFWGVREYHSGDPLRRLDWRKTARHPHQFFTKEFEQEEIADIGLILDTRGKTNVPNGADSLFEHSARATASLAEVFLRYGNRVSLLLFQEAPVMLYPGYGKTQLNRIVRTLTRATPRADGSLNSLQSMPTHLFSNHSLIVILSALNRGDWRLFPRLRAFGYQVLLISPDPIDFIRQSLPDDPLTKLAVRLTWVERQLEIRKITQLRVPVIDWQVSQPLAPLVRKALGHFHVRRDR